jgi:hypothetical protein
VSYRPGNTVIKEINKAAPFHQLYLINIYVNHIITEWKEQEIKQIKISRNKDITTLLFAHNQVTVADSEDALQISTHKLETFTSKQE